MSDFIQDLENQFKILKENIVVMKRNPMMNINSVEILSNHLDKRLN